MTDHSLKLFMKYLNFPQTFLVCFGYFLIISLKIKLFLNLLQKLIKSPQLFKIWCI